MDAVLARGGGCASEALWLRWAKTLSGPPSKPKRPVRPGPSAMETLWRAFLDRCGRGLRAAWGCGCELCEFQRLYAALLDRRKGLRSTPAGGRGGATG